MSAMRASPVAWSSAPNARIVAIGGAPVMTSPLSCVASACIGHFGIIAPTSG
jgi:hypothetical protein